MFKISTVLYCFKTVNTPFLNFPSKKNMKKKEAAGFTSEIVM